MNVHLDHLQEALRSEVAVLLARPTEAVSIDAPFEEVGLDSMQKLHLMIFLEEQFGVQFDNSHTPQFTSIGAVVQLVQERLAASPAPA